ncbi:MAG: YidC/Oxa1 family membrane protein insertase [Acidimicrobiia bacterium]|nr:YidC/Oxa1 family membrane protein insertase [Acidimicrobiia bacterium]
MNPFTVLAPPLGQALTWLYDIWPNNYGVAIMILTLIVSLLLFPLTLKQTRSMKAMQEIQPEMKALQKEYKDDREELNKQMMALYQERGVNPAAGCLPLILQMPIWFALYRVFRVKPSEADPTVLDPSDVIPAGSNLAEALLNDDSSISFLSLDMLQSPSEAMSEGLSAGIPAILLVLVIVATSYYQVYQTTRRNKANNNGQAESKQAQQMQMITKIMPLFMGFISWTFPMGLGLYFAVSNGFRVAQQAVIFRLDENDDGKGAKSVKGDLAPPEEPKSSGPSPHASKKRNRRRRK